MSEVAPIYATMRSIVTGRIQLVAVLAITALVNSTVANEEGDGHEDAAHHGVQGRTDKWRHFNTRNVRTIHRKEML